MILSEKNPLTGRKVLIITVTAFAFIIAANMTLLFSALNSFPGLETKNSYVASQAFDREEIAQSALNWTVTLKATRTGLELRFLDADGLPIQPEGVTATIGRATSSKDDQTLTFSPYLNRFEAIAPIAPGQWIVWLSATAPDGTAFRQRRAVELKADRDG